MTFENAIPAVDSRTGATRADTAPPRTNFPLPRALRDQIYGYLLSSEHVKEGNKYHFHTNILAVSKEIHDEAEPLLYKKNTFISVSYKIVSSEGVFLCLVPRVGHSVKAPIKMGNSSMTLRVKCVAADVAIQRLPENNKTVSK
jgi:hypothetical protein